MELRILKSDGWWKSWVTAPQAARAKPHTRQGGQHRPQSRLPYIYRAVTVSAYTTASLRPFRRLEEGPCLFYVGLPWCMWLYPCQRQKKTLTPKEMLSIKGSLSNQRGELHCYMCSMYSYKSLCERQKQSLLSTTDRWKLAYHQDRFF